MLKFSPGVVSEKDERTHSIEAGRNGCYGEKTKTMKLKLSGNSVRSQLETVIDGQRCSAPLKKGKKIYLAKNTVIQPGSLADIPIADLEGFAF